MHPAERIRGAKSLKLQGKTIVLGVTGSIAAVETVKLARELIRHGADVYAVLSKSATAIVHPNALQFATGHDVDTQLDGSMRYLAMCGKDGQADLLLIAPCTSNTLSKVANGIDDTTVTTYAVNALGSGIPILIAPAAHETMMDNPAVLENVRKLRALGVEFVEPKREESKAKLADLDEIVARVIRRLGPRDLDGKKVLVIAGSTVEPIDDIRVVSNRSSGATGVELARSAFEHGADVELWIGRHEVPVPSWVPTKSFDSTADLAGLVRKIHADVCLVPAAISDFSPKKRKGKIPSREGSLTLDLEPTPKVLGSIRKATKGTLVGFKAEAGVTAAELKSRAMALLKEADLDLVVANDVGAVKRETTTITIFDPKGHSASFKGPKSLAAEQVWSAVLHGVPG
jgi:phosphopantothenoylcysteine decarboxylase/phosphopantothenate--cysteine ligase